MQQNRSFQASILVASLIVAGSLVYSANKKSSETKTEASAETSEQFQNQSAGEIIALESTILPVKWGDLGARMASVGVIDKEEFLEIYASRGGLDDYERRLLEESDNGNLEINERNAGVILNLLWALGLGNKNPILEKGPMSDQKYGGADRFASTGGWTLARGNAMDHYSRHPLIVLTGEQQKLVEKVSKGIYRPCCGNSTYFPDCNHGMAMLGFLELMASQGIGEKEMYEAALKLNSFWFPDTYATIAQYLAGKGIKWENADPQEILGYNYSSGPGFLKIKQELEARSNGSNQRPKSGGGCGV
ncbi:MAG: hypothetical protein HUT38_03735 [Candidatus Paceibacter sp.]|nr:hypothetical protein [Candidatus Paceibacter sp.]